MKPEPYDPLDTEDIQGNILRGYTHPCAAYLFVNIPNGAAERARTWLGELVKDVTAECIPGKDTLPDTTLNIAFTCSGLAALGVPVAYIESFPKAFRDGLAARIGGQKEENGKKVPPPGWDEVFTGDDRHVLLTIYAAADGLRDTALANRTKEAEDHGLKVVHDQIAGLLKTPKGQKDQREHFGFADGLSQPAVRFTGEREKRPQGAPSAPLKKAKTKALSRWRPLEPGEFILGYADNDGTLPEAPMAPFAQNGTFMVYLKLHQDVPLFREFIRTAVERPELGGMSADKLRAKLVGRWPDGTPLVTSPDAPLGLDENSTKDHATHNDFRYDADPDGYACPLGAHIRRTNPRDALGWEDLRSRRHRIIRRGMPYGERLPENPSDDERTADRGLIFVCFNASLERQFETIQHQWCDDGNLFGLGNDRDFLLASHDGTGTMTIQGQQPVFLNAPHKPFVDAKGGDYLFVPGISALRRLAAGIPELPS